MLWATREAKTMKIMLTNDGLEHSRRAIEETAELAANGKADVTVVSVVPESEARATKSGGHRWAAPHAHVDVAIAHKQLRERGIESDMKILYGDPVEEICREALEGCYDLIVAGSRQRGTVGRLVLGSVSGKLVNNAPCPVLVAGKDVAVSH